MLLQRLWMERSSLGSPICMLNPLWSYNCASSCSLNIGRASFVIWLSDGWFLLYVRWEVGLRMGLAMMWGVWGVWGIEPLDLSQLTQHHPELYPFYWIHPSQAKATLLLREFNWDSEGLETAFSQRTRLADTEMFTIGSVWRGRLPQNDTAMANSHKVAWDSASSRMSVNAIEVVVEHIGMMVQIWREAQSCVSWKCDLRHRNCPAQVALISSPILLTYHPQPHCTMPKAHRVYNKSSRLLLSHISDNRIWSSLQYFMHS